MAEVWLDINGKLTVFFIIFYQQEHCRPGLKQTEMDKRNDNSEGRTTDA